jgi:hypothetical protein
MCPCVNQYTDNFDFFFIVLIIPGPEHFLITRRITDLHDTCLVICVEGLVELFSETALHTG